MRSLHNAIEPQGPGLLAEAQKSLSHPESAQVHLPRLLYVGDVPVESSCHGSVQFYRLLENYPAERLCVVEGSMSRSLPERRLPSVVYETLETGSRRLLHTRFRAWYSLWLTFRSAGWARSLSALLRDFKPEAVLTVANGYLWVTAAEFARQNRLPLHLVVHDDSPRMARL